MNFFSQSDTLWVIFVYLAGQIFGVCSTAWDVLGKISFLRPSQNRQACGRARRRGSAHGLFWHRWRQRGGEARVSCRVPNERRGHRDGLQQRSERGQVRASPIRWPALFRSDEDLKELFVEGPSTAEQPTAGQSCLIFGNIHVDLRFAGLCWNGTQNFWPTCLQCSGDIRKVMKSWNLQQK